MKSARNITATKKGGVAYTDEVKIVNVGGEFQKPSELDESEKKILAEFLHAATAHLTEGSGHRLWDNGARCFSEVAKSSNGECRQSLPSDSFVDLSELLTFPAGRPTSYSSSTCMTHNMHECRNRLRIPISAESDEIKI